VLCADGTTATLKSGPDGATGNPGAGCTAVATDGGIVVTCGDASTTISSGQTGSTGNPGQSGLNAGQTPGLTATASVAAPPNGKNFVTGNKLVYTATLTTADGQPVDLDYFSSAGLYLNGPRDVLKDKTASKLLGCNTDRTKQPHHYIDLKASPAPAGLVVNGNTITFTTNAVSDEDPGTYTFGLRLVPKDYVFDQVFELTDVQIKTDVVEPLIVGVDKADGTGSCADCHKGAANGKEYMHHIDPGYSPTGSPALDAVPVRTCLMCHNQDGYSAIQVCADGTKAGHGGVCGDGSTPTYMVDPIVRRVHGVHMGENLKSKLDTGPGGDFENYAGLAFPAGDTNCQKCHSGTDDAWKTKPSREACGACHDYIDFSTGNFTVNDETDVTGCTVDSDCTSAGPTGSSPVCNTTSGVCELTRHAGGAQADDSNCAACHGPGAQAPIDVVHKMSPPDFKLAADIAMSAPANGTDYEAGETPTVTITVKDSSGAALDPTKFTKTNKDVAELFVSGPRMDTAPVLTTAAANPNPTGYYVYNDLLADASPADPKYTPDTTNKAFVYKLDDVAGLEPGTYTVFFVVTKAGAHPESWAVKNFQVGTATEEQMVATNCTDCHEDSRMHEGYFAVTFSPDICKSCHDYQPQNSNNAAGWGSANSNYGFGAAPLNRRVHGVHFGKYLSHPEQIHKTADEFNDIVFPQDVRNCTKCHDDTATAGTWKTEPDRVACLACHDSDADQAHGALMTVDPTPSAPYSGDEVESCESCHGAGKQFGVDKVHNISDPYVMPYPR